MNWLLNNSKKWILSILVGFIFFQSLAQQKTDEQFFQTMAQDVKIKEDALFEKALQLAKKNNWPLTILGKDGNIAQLVGVDAMGFPMYVAPYSNIRAAATIGTNALWAGGSTGLNLSGASNFLKGKLGIWDGGRILSTHQELAGRITQRDNPSSNDNHATHVAGTLIASGVNPVAKGMAHGLQELIAYDFNNHLSEMTTEAANLLVSNHSYGTIAGWRFNDNQNRWEFYGLPGENEDYKFGFYDSQAQLWDSLAFLSPNYLIVKSAGNNRTQNGPNVGENYFRYDASGNMINAGARPAGISSNDGYDIIPTYGTAKNILTVGSVLPLANGYTRPSDVVLSNFSSWGPTDDGRIKPDIVANGANLTSSYATGNDQYASISGTSMSSPTIAGSAILLYELFAQRNNNAIALSSTIKGLIIHTADEAGASPGPDYQNGWGLANIKKAAEVITNTTQHRIEQRVLNNGNTYSFNVVATGKEPLKATICWTDPKGEVTSGNPVNDRSRKLINDLDIRIKRGNNTYLPWKLDPTNPSLPAFKGDNILDNVEQVLIDSTIAGETYTIEVSHKGTLLRNNNSQSYSLIVSGIGGTAYGTSAANDNAGSKIDSVGFAGIRNTNTAGCKTYSDYRNIIGRVEPGQTLPLSIKVNSCDASNAAKSVKVFIDFNQDGDFVDNGETILTQTNVSNGTIINSNITLPNNLIVGGNLLMRIVLVETTDAATINPTGNYTKGETQDYSLTVVNPSNDLAVMQVVSPEAGNCANTNQYVTVKVKNLGTISITGVPITVEVKNGSTVVANLSGTYAGSIAGGAEADYTLQTPVNLQAGVNYTFTVNASYSQDQLPSNNQLITSVAIAAASLVPDNGAGVICNNTTALMKATAANSNSLLSWYTTPTGGAPFAIGASNSIVQTTTITSNKTYYASANDVSGTIGPVNKMVYPSGGYNAFSGNFVRFSNSVPVVIETARLYIGNPGKINIIVADLVSETETGYSYIPLASTNITVTNTRPTPQSGAVTENNPADTGAVYLLNLPVTSTGNHVIIVQCQDGATIYRNNNIASSPYPQLLNGVSNLFTITGNSVPAAQNPDAFYYFFYNMRVRATNGCASPRASVVAVNNTVPTITQNGNTLTSTATSGNQWQLNGANISGANGTTLNVTQSGTYRTVVVDAFGCASTSNEINVVVTSVTNVNPEEISLTVSPNPNKGDMRVKFKVNGRADLNLSIISSNGQTVYNHQQKSFTGWYNQSMQLSHVAAGVYMVQVIHGNKMYVKKVVITP